MILVAPVDTGELLTCVLLLFGLLGPAMIGVMGGTEGPDNRQARRELNGHRA